MSNFRFRVLLVALTLIISCMFSCVTRYERQKIKAEKFYSENPKDLAKICADNYPVKETIRKGKDSLITDTVFRTDSVFVERIVNGKTEYVKIPCPTNKTINRYIYRTDTVKIENTAKISSLSNDLNKVRDLLDKEKQSLIKAKKTKNIFMYISIGLFVLIIVGIAYLIRSKVKL